MFIGKWRTWLRFQSKLSRRPRTTGRRRCPLWLEQLETRQLLSAFTVNTTDDTDVLSGALGDGTGHDANGHVSLRSAIEEANYEKAPATINFAIGTGKETITSSGLPSITVPITIDGNSQPGFTPADPMPLIQLVGSSGATVGLTVRSDGSTVKGLVIDGFSSAGISVVGNGTVVEGNYVGTDAGGTSALANGIGVDISGSKNTIGGLTPRARNLISGNTNAGVSIDPGAHENQVLGNFIGTDATGTAKLGNLVGVAVTAVDSTIGGTTPEARNLISGNGSIGIMFGGGSGNVVEGNYIGTDVTGAFKLGNAAAGVSVVAPFSTIGGTLAGAGNVISGNGGNGISFPPFAADILVAGNFIGTDAAGTAKLGNALDGVLIVNGHGIAIGGAGAAARNIISGNGGNGVSIIKGQNRGNLVAGNFIGTDKSGATSVDVHGASLGNALDGVLVADTPNDQIGGTAAGAGNTISGNKGNGVHVAGSAATKNLVQGNFIGTDSKGMTTTDSHGMLLGNALNGVLVDGAPSNTIGGTAAGASNIVSGNTKDGILFQGAGIASITVQGNLIGTDAAAQVALPNMGNGVEINSVPGSNIGGSAPGAGNTISGNAGAGIYIHGSGATGTFVKGNFVGTQGDGVTALGNTLYGVIINDAASHNLIGGTDPGAANTIAYNGAGLKKHGHGIIVADGTANSIRRNSIFKNAGRGIALGTGSWYDTLNDLGDGDSGANNLQNYPVLLSVMVNGGKAMIHGMLNSQPSHQYAIEFFANSAPNMSGFGDGEKFLDEKTVTTNVNGHVDFDFMLADAGSPDHFIAATATDTLTDDTSGFSMISTAGDGIADAWKTDGIDINEDGKKVDILTLPGANTNHKDIYVEVDAMAGRAPAQATLDKVVAAFAAAPNALLHNPDGQDGINLHATLDQDDANIPLQGFPNAFADFDRIKAAYFGTAAERDNPTLLKAKALVYHYCLFADTYGDPVKSPADYFSSGLSRGILSNDFMVTLGSQGGWLLPGGVAGTPDEQAGTFMHELGHNLGLHHGGGGTVYEKLYANQEVTGDDTPNKPNYHSVMNYIWQTPYRLPKGGSTPEERAYHNSWTLDYSRQALLPLDEAGLVEVNGIGGNPAYTVQLADGTYVPESGPIDWDGDGIVDAIPLDHGVDINNDNKIQVLLGHEDWSQLSYYFLESPNVQAHGVEPPVESELTLAMLHPNPADLSITLANPPTLAHPGDRLTYVFTVTNNGPNPVTAAHVTDILPATLTGAQWICTASTGSSCAATSGTGNINTTVNLLNGGTATFTLSATVDSPAPATLTNTAEVAPPPRVFDPDLGNNSVTATLQIVDPSTSFVTALYRDLLQRAPEPAGLAGWVQALQHGASRLQVASAIYQSPEHRGLQVDQDYLTFLHRSSDAVGRAGWVSAFVAGVSETDVIRAFLNSPEYMAAHADPTAFVTGLYKDVLARAPDSDGEAGWLKALSQGVSRDSVAIAFLTSAEAYKNSVDGYYHDYLGRAADSSGEAGWIFVLQKGLASAAQVAEFFLATDEFFAHSLLP